MYVVGKHIYIHIQTHIHPFSNKYKYIRIISLFPSCWQNKLQVQFFKSKVQLLLKKKKHCIFDVKYVCIVHHGFFFPSLIKPFITNTMDTIKRYCGTINLSITATFHQQMRFHYLMAYTFITIVQTKGKINHKMHCSYMYCKHTHTHTHTYIYIYRHIYTRFLNKYKYIRIFSLFISCWQNKL